MVTLDPADPLSSDLLARLGTAISDFVAERAAELAQVGPEVADLTGLAAAFTAGGKRLRPGFCCWGYLAARGGSQVPDPVLRAAASLDLLHVSALVHDDVMDGSATRRGVPAAHVQLAGKHAAGDRRGNSDEVGRAGAILLGDLLLVWSAQLFAGCGADLLARAQPLIDTVRSEVTAGQYLDISAQTRSPLDAADDPDAVLAQVRRVVEFKTARYTVIRPLQIGAALGGASAELSVALERFGSPLGRAFQFRDDLLGVFGDEVVTGKPAGDDLREGKLTVLIAHAMADSPRADAEELAQLLGEPLSAEQVARARRIIVDSGAVVATEAEIAHAAADAVAVLRQIDLPEPAATGLRRLVELAVRRDS